MEQPPNITEQGGSSKQGTASKETKIKWNIRLWMNLDTVVICVLIIVLWILLSLPMIFYHLPGSEISYNTSTNGDAPSGDSVCSAPLEYVMINGVCQTEFTNILTFSNCPLGPEGNVLVVRNEEGSAIQLINELTSIGASVECIRKVIPFMCQHLFGLCGGSGISIQPNSSQCEELRDTICPKEWVSIERLYMDLQDCAMFPAEASSCPALNDSYSTNETFQKNMLEEYPGFLNRTTEAVLECSEDFYQENGSDVCTPSCYTWIQFSKEWSLFRDVLTFVAAFIEFVACAAVIVISCIVYKRMLAFPSIFIVYMMLDILVFRFITMISFIDRNKLFCSSRSLFESMTDVTPFCVINGVVSTYVFLQVAVWWLFHTAVLFWRVVFPFHARSFSKLNYLHLICLVVGILLPLVPIISIMADFAVDVQKENIEFLSGGLGFVPNRFPPIMCSSKNFDSIFYSTGLMIDIIAACGSTMLLIIVWFLHRLIRRKRKQKKVKFEFGSGEKKLLIALWYFSGFSLLHITVLTLYALNIPELKVSFQMYFLCERGGYNPNNPCSRSEFQALSYPSLDILLEILAIIFPFVNLLYAVNIQELKELRKK